LTRLLIACFFLLALTLATGPLRAGVASELATPPFLLECVAGAGAVALAAWTGMALAVPGRVRVRPWTAAVALAVGAWLAGLGAMAAGWLPPALEPSMAGKRDACAIEAVVFALPSLALGLALAARRMPLARARTGAVIGFAAGGVPAWLMQLACMYEPGHAALFHVGPAVAMAALGALAGRRVFRRL